MHSRWWWGFVLLAVNIGLRMTWTVTHPSDLKSDPDLYVAHAAMLVNGHGFAGPSTGRPTAFRPIGYPLALAIVQWAGATPVTAVVLINMASAMAVLWLVRVYGRQNGWRESSIRMAQLATAMDPLLVRYFGLPMTEVPCGAILLAAVVCLGPASFGSLPDGRTPGGGKARSFFAGALFGWAGLVRPVGLIAAAVVTGGLLLIRLTAGCRARKPLRGCLADPLLLAVGVTLVLAPWVIRNALVFHAWIPATTHGGYTLALANNAQFYADVIRGTDEFPWDGGALNRWQQQMMSELRRDGIAPADERAEDAWFYRRAGRDIAADREAFRRACLLRLGRFWSFTAADPDTPVAVRAGVGVWYAVLWAGLIFGCWKGSLTVWRHLSCRGGGNSEQSCPPWGLREVILWLIVLSFAGMHTVYWTDTRMRAPIMPLLILLSVAGWTSLRPATPRSDQV